MLFSNLGKRTATAVKPATNSASGTALENMSALDYGSLLQALEAFVDAQGEAIERLVKGEEAA